MDKYYYLITQLPMLFLGKETPMTIAYFLDESKKWMSEKDFSLLSQVDINNFSVEKKEHPVSKMFKQFEYQLRHDMAMWRKAKQQNLDYKPLCFPVSVLKDGNPLEIEKRFMELRWTFIDELERNHHFDLGMLILYYLKLQILRRLFTFNKETGFKTFQKLYEVAL